MPIEVPRDGDGELAKFWYAVVNDLKSRGVKDIFFTVCDGLKGPPDAVNSVFPATIVQTCIIHLIRDSFRYASLKYRDELARDLKPICQAANADTAAATLDVLGSQVGDSRLIGGLPPMAEWRRRLL